MMSTGILEEYVLEVLLFICNAPHLLEGFHPLVHGGHLEVHNRVLQLLELKGWVLHERYHLLGAEGEVRKWSIRCRCHSI